MTAAYRDEWPNLPPGSFVIERYTPAEGGVQWLAQVVGQQGGLWLMSVERTRRAALAAIDKHGTQAARNAHD